MKPWSIQFLSADPVQADDKGGDFNRYWYAGNNPYKFNDPDGRQQETGEPGQPDADPNNVGSDIRAIEAAEEADPSLKSEPVHNSVEELHEFMELQGNEPLVCRAPSDNTNPYKGPVSEPVVVVDSDGNAIPVGKGQQIGADPAGKFQEVKDSNGKPTGTRMDKGGHPKQPDPKARDPHGHVPGKTDESGNPHLPLNSPRPVDTPIFGPGGSTDASALGNMWN